MMAFDTNLRPTYDDILCHPWMMGQFPTINEVTEHFQKRRIIVKAHEKATREQ